MSTQTQDPASQAFNEDLYNILMGAIEPDLTTQMIPVLDEVYLGETEQEREKRMERYAAAIDEFRVRAAQFAHNFKHTIWQIGEHAMQLATDAQQQQDQDDLQQTESQLDNE